MAEAFGQRRHLAGAFLAGLGGRGLDGHQAFLFLGIGLEDIEAVDNRLQFVATGKRRDIDVEIAVGQFFGRLGDTVDTGNRDAREDEGDTAGDAGHDDGEDGQ